jgi:hypothetical protein
VGVNKRMALFFLLTNVAFIATGLLKFVLFYKVFETDIFKRPYITAVPAYHLLTWAGAIFGVSIFIGLYWVLRIFKEPPWIWLSIIIFLIWKIILILFFNLIQPHIGHFLLHNNVFIDWGYSINIIVSIYMLAFFLFVKNPVIKRFLVAFAILMGVVYFFQYAGPTLYDNYGLHWALINVELLIYIAHLATLLLFAKLYDQADKLNTLSGE